MSSSRRTGATTWSTAATTGSYSTSSSGHEGFTPTTSSSVHERPAPGKEYYVPAKHKQTNKHKEDLMGIGAQFHHRDFQPRRIYKTDLPSSVK
ncbi:hypothetical protein F4777DRAFT_578721 [Nemania sp. FL0916]|nr:hypothetical protein F4777DRAFT_578721 [Nemania sp. FL0916]